VASKAAKARHSTPSDEIVELRQELRDLAEQIRQKKVTPGVGSVVNQVLGTLLKTFEQQRRQQEFDDVIRRLENVERRYAQGRAQYDGDSRFNAGRWSS